MPAIIVDAHTHVYPDPRAGIGAQGGKSRCGYDGTAEHLLAAMHKAGISTAVMLNFTPTGSMRDAALAKLPASLSAEERQQAENQVIEMLLGRIQRRNLWTCELAKQHPNLVPFIGVDPAMSADVMKQEVMDMVLNHGARGVKLHSGEQRCYPNDPGLLPAYEAAQELRVPVYAHSGRVGVPVQFAEPRYFAEVLTAFPRLKLVLGHLGQGFWDQAVALVKKFPNVNFCCTGLLDWQAGMFHPDLAMKPERLVSLIRDFGAGRVVWGSEYPFYDLSRSVQGIRDLGLTERETALVLGGNAVRIYGLRV